MCIRDRSSLSKGENLVDTVKNILAMKVDMIVIRHPAPGAALYLSRKISSCIINAGDGTHEHPTQALLDAYSLIEKFGELANKKILILGDILHSRVALSNILLLVKLGAHVKLCGPKTLIPKDIEILGVTYEINLKKGLKWCDAINVLRIQNERMNQRYFPSVREYSNLYGLDESKLDELNKKLVILHPGPINRGIEISSTLADSSQSVILDQVHNGVAIRMAVTYLLASKLLI